MHVFACALACALACVFAGVVAGVVALRAGGLAVAAVGAGGGGGRVGGKVSFWRGVAGRGAGAAQRRRCKGEGATVWCGGKGARATAKVQG